VHVYINLGDDCLLLKGARKKKRAEKANIMEIVITNLLQIINPKVRAGSFNKLQFQQSYRGRLCGITMFHQKIISVFSFKEIQDSVQFVE
jgi:hypothetical protein